MADLPDLNTSDIGYIAYWNAIDQGGVPSIDPSTALSDSGIVDYTLYDNGWEATYNAQHGQVTVRVKTDGWIVAYQNRSTERDEFARDVGTVQRGSWDVIRGWAGGHQGDLVQNQLERVVQSVASNLDKWDSISYASADVGLYNYEFPGATSTLLSQSVYSTGPDDTASPGFLYTTDTDIKYAVAVAASDADGNSWENGDAIFEGVTLLQFGDWDGHRFFGTYDLLANGAIPNADTEYTASMSTKSDDTAWSRVGLSILSIWE